MNFNFGKNNLFKQNFLNSKENTELDDKLDNIYESIQNIVFNESKINKLKSNNINMNIEPNDLSLQKEENIYKSNKDFNDEEFIKLLLFLFFLSFSDKLLLLIFPLFLKEKLSPIILSFFAKLSLIFFLSCSKKFLNFN